MSTFTLDSDDALAAVIRSHFYTGPNSDLHLQLRNGEGVILWAHTVDEWSTDSREVTVRTRPLRERIEVSVDTYRLGLELQLQAKGLL